MQTTTIITFHRPLCLGAGLILLPLGLSFLLYSRQVHAFIIEMRENSPFWWETLFAESYRHPFQRYLVMFVGGCYLFIAVMFLAAGVFSYDILNQAWIEGWPIGTVILVKP
jgi:hypothetical protein